MPRESKRPNFERRTRIICHFPLNRQPDEHMPNQLYVVRDFVKYLQKTDLTGFSMSSLMDTFFTGFWRAHVDDEFEEENVVLLMIDHPLDRNDPGLWNFVAQMKHEIQKLYRRHTGEQETEIWIVIHPIDRLV